LTRYHGNSGRATGAALAWSIRVALDALLLFIAVRRLGPLPSYSFVFDTVTQISLFLLLLACVVIGISSLPLGTWLRFLGLGIAFFPVGILGWRYMLDGKDRDQIAKLLSLASVK
jgi:hypothetical protein